MPFKSCTVRAFIAEVNIIFAKVALFSNDEDELTNTTFDPH